MFDRNQIVEVDTNHSGDKNVEVNPLNGVASKSIEHTKRRSLFAITMLGLSIMTWGCRMTHLQLGWALEGHYICHTPKGNEALLHAAVLVAVSAAELFAATRLARQLFWRRQITPWIIVDLATLSMSTIYLLIAWCSLSQVGCHPGEFLAMLAPYTNASLGLLIAVSIADGFHLLHAIRRHNHRAKNRLRKVKERDEAAEQNRNC